MSEGALEGLRILDLTQGVAGPYGADQPSELSLLSRLPQHATAPSVLIPQAWLDPALTEMKEPPGGEDSPTVSSPQHTIEPSALIPQVKYSPALTELKEPLGGLDQSLSPLQQATAPSVLTPQVWSHPALTEMNEPPGGVDCPE